MEKNELNEKYMKLYYQVFDVKGFYSIVLDMLRYNEGNPKPTDILPVAELLENKVESLCIDADYFMWELLDRKLI